jgi:exopolyphosphatase/pppGpp-phosphohydrolase
MYDKFNRLVARAVWLAIPLLFAPLPARADLHGGIEIGAKGVKAAILDVYRTATGYEVKKASSLGTTNTTLSARVGAAGELDPAAVKATVGAVSTYLAVMEKKHKVPSGNIYVVGSSGIFAAVEADSKAVAAGQKELAAAVRKGTGRELDFITVAQEAELSIVGTIPRAYRASSLLIDIGSGNTKGGYQLETRKYTTFGVPYGSVTFGTAVKKKFGGDPLVSASEKGARSLLMPALREAIKSHRGLLERDHVYLSGGAVWALATFMRPADRETFTVLTADDINRYHKVLASSPAEYPAVNLSTIENPGVRAAAEKEIAGVKKVFTPQQLLWGSEILKGLSEELKLDDSKKKMHFARYGYLSWILAYSARKSAKS